MTTTTDNTRQPTELDEVEARTALDRKRLKRKELWTNRSLMLPAVIFLIVMTQIPFLTTIGYSLTEWNLLYPQDRQFAGLDNYTSALTSGDLWPSIMATVQITALSVTLAVLFGLLFAVLLDRQFRGRALARTLMITPFLIMPAAASLIWKYSMFDTNIGMVNWLFRSVGLPVVSWGTEHPMATVVIVLTWQFTPFMMLILLAGLQGQDKGILEAALVDGAGPWRTFTWITLPHLRMYIEIGVLLGSVIILQVFDPIAILTKGTGGTKTLAYLLYERAFIGLDIGQAAAYGVVTVILTIIVATIALKSVFKVFMAGGSR
jgi:polyol transport system permease protein